MAVEFWLISGNERLRLPVNPESNTYTSPFGYTDTDVEGLGEVTNFGYRKLRDFPISTFWPKHYNPTYCGYTGFITPDAFVKKIESWRAKRQYIRYVVTGAGGVNTPVTIRDFQVEGERAGSPGDVYFTLALKEYRFINVAVIDTSKPKPGTTPAKPRPAPAKPAQVKTYVVKKNDSLWKIAAQKSIYGDGNKWPKIHAANIKIIGKNPHKIFAGQKLVIPK